MTDMSTSFDETKHPRVAGGQFTDKTNRPPTSTLEPVASEADRVIEIARVRAEVAQFAAYDAERVSQAAAVERMMAHLHPTAPENAASIVVWFEEGSWEGSYPRFRHFADADGNELDSIDDELDDDLELYALEDEIGMEASGFEQIRDTDNNRTEHWKIALRAPAAGRVYAGTAPRNSTTVSIAESKAGLAGTGFGSMLMASAGESENAHLGLSKLTNEQFAELASKYEVMMRQMRAEITRLASDN